MPIDGGFWGRIRGLLGAQVLEIVHTPPAVEVKPLASAARATAKGTAPANGSLEAFDYFLPVLGDLIDDAGLERALIWPHREALRVAANSNSPRDLDRALRLLLPAVIWSWPGYEKWSKHADETPTRLRMVAAVAGTLLRRVAVQQRAAQLIENVGYRPYWQLRAVGDARDWPSCAKATGTIQKWDSQYWRTHGPHQCVRIGCRCALRAYTTAEAAALSGQ